MQMMTLLLMIGVLAFNLQGLLSVGPEHASGMQWAVTVAMGVFVAIRVVQMVRRA